MVTQINEEVQSTTTETPVLVVTPGAVSKIRELLQERDLDGYSLRVFVSGGGCSGLQYGMAFEPAPDEYDTRIEVEGISLLVDPTSMQYLQGATIDFVEDLMSGGFRIDNPNAVSSCGCGHSFRTSDDSAEEGGSCGCGGGGCG
jgi:iron-sulfur cluster assembly accessory protein